MRLQRYNYTTGKAEPLPIEKAVFRIYKPPTYTVEAALELDNGEVLRQDVSLSDEDNILFHQLEMDEERSAFLNQPERRHQLIAQAIKQLRAEPAPGEAKPKE
jgi:hypothetical protein